MNKEHDKSKRIYKAVGITAISIAVFIMIFSIISMKEKKPVDDKQFSGYDRPDETITVDSNGINEAAPDDINETDMEDIIEEPNLEDFFIIKEYFKDYIFEVSYDDSLDYFDRIYNVHGSYDLDGDGKEDIINAVLKPRDDSSYIEVNGLEVSIYPDHPTGEIFIIDMDSRDNYLEVAVFDDGPSGDPIYMFFRYDGKELYSVGSIDEFAYMDGQGKFISIFDLSKYFEPKFYFSWKEHKDGEFASYSHDVEQYIGRYFILNGNGYFVSLEESPDDYYKYVTWDYETIRDFKDVNIRLLDIYGSSSYYVELPNGERGLLYFWTGD